MRISFNWLKEFVDIPDDWQELGYKLTMVGLAVDAAEAIGHDTIFELDITTNRPDCLSHLGVAREVSAIYGTASRTPRFVVHESDHPATDVFSISIADPDLCARYCGRYVEGVKIGPSPGWLKRRLETLGVRSINNVADVTNYVMLELGQPLHAFDANTLQGRQIIVRRAELDENLTTLDGVNRRLNPSVLVIADANRPVALAGVMGGEETEISLNTTDVLLESANFNALSIRKTSRNLGLVTEASYRFERGADVEMAKLACDRAAAMIQELAGGKIYRGVIDTYPSERKPLIVNLRRHRIGAYLGAPVEDSAVEGIFKKLGFRASGLNGGWSVEVPSFRVDVEGEEDLLEEVARHYGYDRFPATLPKWTGHGSGLPYQSQERVLRELLSGRGYSEIYGLSFSDEELERKFRPDIEPEKPVNPLTEDASALRTSLVASVLKAIQWNNNRGIRDLQLFELSKVYRKGSENRTLILAAMGGLQPKTAHDSAREFDFYDIKGDVEEILDRFDLQLQVDINRIPAYYHPGRSARYGEVAVFGELHPEYAELFKFRQRVYVAELDVEVILRSKLTPEVQPIPRYPSIRRDFSMLLEKSVRFGDVRATIEKAKIPPLVRIEPFDRLEKGPFPESMYSLAVSVIYQSAERTLTDAEVEKFDRLIIGLLETELGAQLRK